jgi:hypothetical protein
MVEVNMNELIKVGNIRDRIFELRGHKVILDSDLATLYGVSTGSLNRQVKRNLNRFPTDFMFQLSPEECDSLRCQFGISNIEEGSRSQIATLDSRCQFGTLKGGRRYLPFAFTRNGVNMLASVLRSKIAVQRSIFIMRAFSALEEAIAERKKDVLSSPDILEQLSAHSKAIFKLFKEGEVNKKEMSIIRRLQEEIGKLLQKIILESIKGDKD